MTASEQHEAVLRLAAKSLSPAQVKLLQFALSLKTESPKIEMYSHLAIDRLDYFFYLRNLFKSCNL